MANNIDLNLPNGIVARVTQPDRGEINTSIGSSDNVCLSSSVFQQGGSGDKHFEYSFSTQTWTVAGQNREIEIVHQLDKYPSVTIVDSFGRVLVVEVDYLDSVTVKLTSSATFSGVAYFN